MALDARAAGRSDDSRMDRPGGQLHAVSWAQLESPSLALQDECDRSFYAVKDLLVVVAVGGVTVAWPVGPRITAARLGAQPCHEVVECWHKPILR